MVYEDDHEVAEISDILDDHNEAMETELEAMMRQSELVIEPELNPERYRCLYFPSFGDEEVVDNESQGHMVVTDEVNIPTIYITDDILHYEMAMKESLLLVLVNSSYHFMRTCEGFSQRLVPHGCTIHSHGHI